MAQFYVGQACVLDSQPDGMGGDEGCFKGTYFFDEDPNTIFRVWDFGDPFDATRQRERGVQHFYTSPGDYIVTLTKFTSTDTLLEQQTITVGSMPMQPKFNDQITTDTTVCAGTSLKLDPFPIPLVGSNYSYLWYPGGDTTSSINVTESGCYSVEVSNDQGCSRTASIKVDFCFEQAANGGGNERWFFGEGATLEFQNSTPPPAEIDSLAPERDLFDEPDSDSLITVMPILGGSNPLNSDVATAMVYGPTGALAFYTDGVNLYDGDDVLITDTMGVAGLNGNNTAAQGLSIVPKANCNECPHHQYYVFSKDADTDILSYSIVDLRYNEGMGQITQRNVPVAFDVSDGLTAVVKGDESGFDIYTHVNQGNGIQRISVDSSGVQISTQNIGTDQDEPESHLGYITFSGDNRKAAQGLVVGGRNMVEVSDRDEFTGELSNPILIDLGIDAPPAVYGLAFSPSGEYLYVTLSGDPAAVENSYLLQVPVYFAAPPTISANISRLDSSDVKRFGALQRGPVNPASPGIRQSIYMVVEGETQVARIQDPDGGSGPTLAGYIEVNSGFDVNGVAKLGLPNITFANREQDGGGISASYIGNCFKATTALTASGICDPMRNEITWKFEDGSSLKGENVNYTFPKLGWNRFEVEFEVFNTSPLKGLVDNQIVNALLELTETSCTKEVYVDSIYIKPTPVSLLEEIGYVCTRDTPITVDTLNAMVSGGSTFTYNWQTAAGVSLGGLASDSIQIVRAPGLYLLDVINDLGCETSDTIDVLDACEPVLFIPSAINTQSSVAQNKSFQLQYRYIENEVLQIFNRWGEIVYETDNLDIKWDGKVNGKVQAPTVYAYKLSYTAEDFPERGVLTEEGAVWVLR